MRRLAAFRKNLKECLEYTRSTEPPEPLPYAVPVAEFLGQCSPGNAVDREIVNCLKEFTIVMPRLSAARLHSVKHFKCDQPIPICHSRQHVRLPAAGHAVIRTKPDSGIRQKCIPGFPSTRPKKPPLLRVLGLAEEYIQTPWRVVAGYPGPVAGIAPRSRRHPGQHNPCRDAGCYRIAQRFCVRWR
jgi:hypothetical protein